MATAGIGTDPKSASGCSCGKRAWRAFAMGTLVTFALMSVWAVTMPPYSGPDEPSQAAHAAALVRGQLIGTSTNPVRPLTTVIVPGTLGNGQSDIRCYQYKPRTPASCAAGVRLTPRPVAALTYSARYPPLYYALTGLTSLVDQSSSALIYMRLVSAFLSAVMLGLAYMTLVVWSTNRLLPVGLLAALTPTAVYLGGTLNPNGLEIAAAISLWCAGVVFALEHLQRPPSGLVLAGAVSAGVLICSRGLSPGFAFLVIITLVALVGPHDWRKILSTCREMRWAALVLGVLATTSVVWIVLARSLWLLPAGASVQPDATELSIVGEAFAQTRIWVEQMVGVFGWDDTSAPTWTYRIWAIAIVLLVVLAVRAGSRRGLLLLGWLVALSLLLPVVLSLPSARSIGIAWQGRYILPLAVGIPVLSAALGAQVVRSVWIGRTFIVALWLASLLAYLEAVRRYAVGIHGPLNFLGGAWRPVEGWPLALGGYLFTTGLLGVLFWRLPRQDASVARDVEVVPSSVPGARS
jgi:hypothetical protein